MSLDYKNYMLSNNPDDYYDEVRLINTKEHINEYMMLGFRKTSGININNFNNTFHEDFEKLFGTALKIYQGMGMINKVQDNYFLTEAGLNVSNSILSDLLR
jgi:oxygen-independent coproporphyrinogen-3 oxidase